MNEFPKFMRNSINMVDPSTQYTPGIEGYVFDGLDGSQMAFWTYKEDAISEVHDHIYDEYVVVVQGQYDITINNKVVSLKAGDEYLISKGITHGGKAYAGTRAIYAFGGKRAKRKSSKGFQ